MRTYSATDIENDIRFVQVGTSRNIMRPICIVCSRFLGKWDIRNCEAVCWRCRKSNIPVREGITGLVRR